ncbi:MAG TPA: M48 family metalloprotease [Gaiellales bacterium]|jgi:STE24 endopeptidase|nr:M48 family metalloprotease [Gaiellales bacterium]
MGAAVDARDEGAVAAGGDDPFRQAEARAYARAGRIRGRVRMVVFGVLVVAAAFAGARIADALATPGPLPLDAAVYAWAALAASWLAGLPFALLGWRAARRAGLSHQRLPSWFEDQAKTLAIGSVLAPLVLWGLVAALREWPHGWWVPVTIGSIALELLLTVVTPVLIIPLFLRSHPLPPGRLADDLHALAARAGVHVQSLRVLEASEKVAASNAFVAGIGPTRRIVLFDNLLGDDPETERQLAETRSVLAHEFGHHATGDLWRLTAASAAATAIALAVVAAVLPRLPDALVHPGAGAFAMLPALLLCTGLAQVVAGIVLGAYSRRRERAADAYGIALVGDGEPFARALENLCATNLAELRPPRLDRWLGAGHPPPYERIARARSSGKENPTSGANGAL